MSLRFCDIMQCWSRSRCGSLIGASGGSPLLTWCGPLQPPHRKQRAPFSRDLPTAINHVTSSTLNRRMKRPSWPSWSKTNDLHHSAITHTNTPANSSAHLVCAKRNIQVPQLCRNKPKTHDLLQHTTNSTSTLCIEPTSSSTHTGFVFASGTPRTLVALVVGGRDSNAEPGFVIGSVRPVLREIAVPRVG